MLSYEKRYLLDTYNRSSKIKIKLEVCNMQSAFVNLKSGILLLN